ncbi:MAG: glycosyltransferase [Lachnospiraceae bacterium]|nr:glycosyltransferase [Lachnospiraceae bacterium]MDE6186394.1 glycosyltransferase [Lachnospiraceae bacterium]MDE7286786.1 glycosyltransferase [Lachnospiraceae bacterium]
MLPISVCMIAKNEEPNVHKCLTPLKKLGFELIIADTGSTDHTRDLISQYTDHLYHFEWTNDFSAARNFSISKASNDWILVIDFDEYLKEANLPSLISFIGSHQKEIGTITRHNPCSLLSGQASIMTEQVARLFNKNYNSYRGIIHEQVLPLDDSSPVYCPVDLSFHHHGYENEDCLTAKARRNLELLLLSLKAAPNDPYLLFQTGKCYQILKDYPAACQYFDAGLSCDLDPALTYVQEMIESYGYCLLEQKEYEAALSLVNVYEIFSSQSDFVFLMGLIYMNNALFDQAVCEFQKAASMKNGKTAGINSYMPNYNIGVIYECTGNKENAVKFYAKCGNYAPAKHRLSLLSPPL